MKEENNSIDVKEGELVPASVGRKSLYKPHYKDDLIDAMKQGKSITQIAAMWGVSRNTVHVWIREKEELKEAYDIAKTAGEAFWEDVGNAATFGQIKGFNTKVYEMNMRNRFGWGKDEKSPHQTINIENMNIQKMSEEEIDKKLAALIEEAKRIEGFNEQASEDSED